MKTVKLRFKLDIVREIEIDDDCKVEVGGDDIDRAFGICNLDYISIESIDEEEE